MASRVYVHDAHGRHVNGDVRVQRSSTNRSCGGYRCGRVADDGLRGIIPRGAWYGVATLYPSDEDFNYLKPDTLEPSTTAIRLKLCTDCLGEQYRDIIAALECDLNHAERSQ